MSVASTRWRRVTEIAADAFELAGKERAAYLDRACAGDSGLRTEVERLVREHERPSPLPERLRLMPARSERSLIAKSRLPETPSSRGAALPESLLERARERLGVVALAYAVAYVAVHVLNELTVHAVGSTPFRWTDHWPSLVVAAVSVAASLALFAAIRAGRVGTLAVVPVGLAYEVAGGLGMALGDYAGGTPAVPTLLGPTWLCVWIVAFPFIVPSPPRQATVAALLTAATMPLAMALAVAAGALPPPAAPQLLVALAPVFFCALLAAVIGRVVFRLGIELRQAQRLGSYRLESLIGRGGMGEVWRASHSMLARPAALKLIRPEVLYGGGESGAIERFEREAQNTASLTSPHTVRLYDYGITEEGVFFYAMELLDGLDLDSLVRRFGPVPPERAVHFLVQICRSLAEAHARGLVHRDVKPANVVACRQGVELDFVKVLDFGLVQQQGARTPEGGGDGALVGTPAYMAPECSSGGPVGPRSDLYAVGCVAYWLLTGGPVFEASTARELVAAHREATPEAPSTRLGGTIPAALDHAVLECLAKQASTRPASAEELAARLEAVDLGREWDQERARAWWAEAAGAAGLANETADARGHAERGSDGA